jgi:hypothetical protein
MNKDKALDLALAALEESHPEAYRHVITAIKQARALDKKAENARELGLDYEPAPVQGPQRYSPDGEGGMEVDSLGAYVKHQDVTTPPAQPAPVEPVACVACEGNPKWGNIPCAVCGATPPAQPAPVQEPVAVIGSGFQLLYCREDWAKGLKIGDTLCLCTPPAAQRQWVSLTNEDYHTNMFSITSLGACDIATIKSIAKDVEAKLKAVNGFHSTEKNNG